MARNRSERVLRGIMPLPKREVADWGVEGTTIVGMLREVEGKEEWGTKGRDDSIGEANLGGRDGSGWLAERATSSRAALRRLADGGVGTVPWDETMCFGATFSSRTSMAAAGRLRVAVLRLTASPFRLASCNRLVRSVADNDRRLVAVEPDLRFSPLTGALSGASAPRC